MKNDEERMKELLRQALPGTGEDVEPKRDLWPSVLQRVSAPATESVAAAPWFDWALLAGLVGFVALFPAAIPVVLYYL